MNSLSLVRGINNASLALAHTIQITESDEKKQTVDQVFDSMENSLKETGESEGSSWFSAGLIALIGGVVGMFTILVSGVELAITVIKRLFKVYMCVPFAPVALAGFAGGREFSQTGIAWLKTFTAYCLEAFVIALAIKLSFGLFASAALNFTIDSADITVQMMLAIFNSLHADGRNSCLCERGRRRSPVLHGIGLMMKGQVIHHDDSCKSGH